MSEWDEEPAAVPRDWGAFKQKAAIAAGCVALIVAWMMFARPGDEASSTRGFNLGGAGGVSSGGKLFATRAPTSLDMVSARIGAGPAGVTAGLYAGSVPDKNPAAAAANPGAAAAPAEAGATAAAAQAPAAPPAADEAKELASAGIPADANSMTRLGGQQGLLSALAAKMLDHPKILAAIFNNKMVVDAFMNREISKKNCQSGGELKSYLSNPNSGGMAKVLPVIQAALSRPETAAALGGTEMAARVMACPSINELSNDSTAVMSVVMSNPKALGVLTDPRMALALSANPQASGLLAGVTSKMGGKP